MWDNADQNNSEYEHFSHSGRLERSPLSKSTFVDLFEAYPVCACKYEKQVKARDSVGHPVQNHYCDKLFKYETTAKHMNLSNITSGLQAEKHHYPHYNHYCPYYTDVTCFYTMPVNLKARTKSLIAAVQGLLQKSKSCRMKILIDKTRIYFVLKAIFSLNILKDST